MESNGLLQNQLEIQNQMQQMYNSNNNFFMNNQFPNIATQEVQ
jgi:hypothetical protein